MKLRRHFSILFSIYSEKIQSLKVELTTPSPQVSKKVPAVLVLLFKILCVKSEVFCKSRRGKKERKKERKERRKKRKSDFRYHHSSWMPPGLETRSELSVHYVLACGRS
mmetsp:Transcript_70563/g.132767  ORF Transcript_70563/g.132767 Transcript_70563/m.132767 type:complete len:109 (-) Transcript_70563:20-346(-)